jgi:hypothetical protein
VFEEFKPEVIAEPASRYRSTEHEPGAEQERHESFHLDVYSKRISGFWRCEFEISHACPNRLSCSIRQRWSPRRSKAPGGSEIRPQTSTLLPNGRQKKVKAVGSAKVQAASAETPLTISA